MLRWSCNWICSTQKLCPFSVFFVASIIYRVWLKSPSVKKGVKKPCKNPRIWSNTFLKITYTRAQKYGHISYSLLHKRPWQSEPWAWQGQAKLFESWGPFLQNMYVPHFMLIFEKKSHPIRPVEGLKLCLDFLCNTDIT